MSRLPLCGTEKCHSPISGHSFGSSASVEHLQKQTGWLANSGDSEEGSRKLNGHEPQGLRSHSQRLNYLLDPDNVSKDLWIFRLSAKDPDGSRWQSVRLVFFLTEIGTIHRTQPHCCPPFKRISKRSKSQLLQLLQVSKQEFDVTVKIGGESRETATNTLARTKTDRLPSRSTLG